MKKITIIFILLFSIPAFGQMKSAKLTASGLTCSMCSRSIYKSLTKLSFIKTVDADVETSSFNIQFKEGSKVVLDDVKKAVQNAGFSVASMQVTASFLSEAVSDDAHITLDGSYIHFVNAPKQTLQGDRTFTVIDKGFLTAAEHKKYSKFTTMKCFETGLTDAACPGHLPTAKRIYHVTL